MLTRLATTRRFNAHLWSDIFGENGSARLERVVHRNGLIAPLASCPSSKLLLGAGTVLNGEQAKIAVDAGAMFVVSPGLNKNVVEYCVNKAIAVYPGVLTPTEIGNAIEL